MVLVPTPPGTLAVVIGLIELFVLETFRIALAAAQSANRRLTLRREHRLPLHVAARHQERLDRRVAVISLALVVIVIILDLSIDGLAMRRTSKLIDAKCHAPDRNTRYFDGFGPGPTQVEDPRFDDYLEQTQCEDRLLTKALAGAGSLEIGYPPCAEEFDELRPRVVQAEFMGCGVGVVSHSPSGDLHCDLMPTGVRNESTLAGTSFVAILEVDENSTSYMTFDGNSKQRLLTNSRVPIRWFEKEPDSVVTVPCENLDVACYELARDKVKDAEKLTVEKEAKGGLYIQVLQNGNSTVCLFEGAMKSKAEWVTMDQLLPGAEERTSRRGPVLTGFVTEGMARCVDVDVDVARLQYDAVEEAMEPPEPEQGMVKWLQKYVVGTGINTPADSEVDCQVFKAIEGSSINRGWLIVACVFSGIIIVLSLVALTYVVYVSFKGGGVDPLTSIWSVGELLKKEGRRRSEESGGDFWVGVKEDEGMARLAAYEAGGFETVQRSTLPFVG